MICQKCNVREVNPTSSKLWCKECRQEARQRAKTWRKEHPKRLHSGNSYLSRLVALRSLGFRSYGEYLNSDLWRTIRTKVLRVKGRLCFMCGKPATSVHHNRYHRNDLIGANLSFLFPVCDDCHKHVEFSRHGKKVDVGTAQNRFGEKVKEEAHRFTALFDYE